MTRHLLPARRLRAVLFAAATLGVAATAAQDLQPLHLPNKPGSIKFAVIGDTGTGSRAQYEVGQQMAAFRARFPFDFVIMVGDNIYGADTERDMKVKFEEPYAALIAAGVRFYASIGNHDNPDQRNYEHFNMGGKRFYSLRLPEGGQTKTAATRVRFFALDTNYLDKQQLDWMEKELAETTDEWKIFFFHHPLYSSARKHGSSREMQEALEPIFTRHGVDVVLQGHDHVYERVKPQKGIRYFVSGSAGSLRKGDLRQTGLTEAGFDADYHFMLMEIEGDELFFQAISREGKTIDKGSFKRRETPGRASPLPPPEPVPAASVRPSPAPAKPPLPVPSASAYPGPTVPSPAPGVVASPKPSPSPTPSPSAKKKPKRRRTTRPRS
ncbi:MAG TPA: metallophosphoesterase [Vicinamibacteria bacterium]|nr:metallophosphoesterase [Vicinamibacteria bacterium]